MNPSPSLIDTSIPLHPFYHTMLGRFECAKGSQTNFVEFLYDTGPADHAFIRMLWGRVDRDKYQSITLPHAHAWQRYVARQREGYVLVNRDVRTWAQHQHQTLMKIVGGKGLPTTSRPKM